MPNPQPQPPQQQPPQQQPPQQQRPAAPPQTFGAQAFPGQQQGPVAPQVDGRQAGAAELPPQPYSPQAAVGIASPAHYRNGKLTRAGMEHVIRNGGSVMWTPPPTRQSDGSFIYPPPMHFTSLDQIPSAADLAAGDEQELDAALAGLDDRQENLDAERTRLLAAQGKAAQQKKQAGASAK